MRSEFRFARIDLEAQVNLFLPENPVAIKSPALLIIGGAPATGKTFLRRRYFTGQGATIDAADIFLSLCCNRPFPFPTEVLRPELEYVGRSIAQRAFYHRMNIVCELSMIPYEDYADTIAAVKQFGYRVEVMWIDCELETALVRNANRDKSSISCEYTNHHHIQWIRDAINGVVESTVSA